MSKKKHDIVIGSKVLIIVKSDPISTGKSGKKYTKYNKKTSIAVHGFNHEQIVKIIEKAIKEEQMYG